RRALEIGGEDRLNRVDDERRGSGRRRRGENRPEVRLAEELDVARVAPEPVGAKLHVQWMLLTRRVERPVAGRVEAGGNLHRETVFVFGGIYQASCSARIGARRPVRHDADDGGFKPPSAVVRREGACTPGRLSLRPLLCAEMSVPPKLSVLRSLGVVLEASV